MDDKGRLVLVEHVEEDQMEAAELAIKCIYCMGMVPDQLAGNGMLLMKTLVLADRFLVPKACIDKLSEALSALKPESLDTELMHALYSLPQMLLQSEELSILRDTTLSCLIKIFGDVPAVIQDEGQRMAFCKLPFHVVLAWAKADDLKVHSENCIVLLLSAWTKANDRYCSILRLANKERLKELVLSIRVQHCSHSYIQTVLPHLPWFVDNCDRQKLIRLQLAKSTGMLASCRGLPEPWMAKPRVPVDFLNVRHQWNVRHCDMDASKAKEEIYSNPIYVNGVYLRMKLSLNRTEMNKCFLGLTLVDPSSHLDRRLKVPLSATVRLLKAGRGLKRWCPISNVFSKGMIRGFHNVFKSVGGVDGLSFDDVLAPFLDGGLLQIETVFEAVR